MPASIAIKQNSVQMYYYFNNKQKVTDNSMNCSMQLILQNLIYVVSVPLNGINTDQAKGMVAEHLLMGITVLFQKAALAETVAGGLYNVHIANGFIPCSVFH